ncbi:nicotinate-nucleotide adenylyltransferase [Cytobacillus sp. IB215316]|uniref:nicotinate-nucleotide adenylyltransferase n=1 Tax=Cytobacillus sp. IB215316 TaxID=3097354 RepID=UPI002A10CC65|nr:nicotinate-nucleotide adenylyltransferase [Cytobacillus sp. IB215316]MDX8359516.1 nicotinate-nucleotide adenylyltransferase [Cytobacillus sp. IB215316]
MKKVGIIGGTFDPPHNGHLLIANEVLDKLHLSEVWFLPTYTPPHKQHKYISSSEDRLKMLRLAIEDNPLFKLNTIEIDRQGVSYTYDTMKALIEKYSDYKFYFIIGADMVEYLPKWYKINDLLELVTFVGVKREQYDLNTNYPILQVVIPQFDVSSSLLQQRLKEGKTTHYLMPSKVRQYIAENRLYET